jgi:cytochrome c5
MSEQHSKMSKTTPAEVGVSILGGLAAPLIAIVLIVLLIVGIQSKQIDTDSAENSAQAVLARIQPVGELNAVDANAPKVEKSGEEVFNASCTACHTSGALGAPKLNAKGDWGSRIGKGFDKLVANAIGGVNAMPPRGGNPDLSDTEIARTVAYMANSAGAKFKAPEAAAPAAASADGKAVYEASCAACHGAGIAGAPKFGDKAAWAARLKGGVNPLVASATKGKGAMPAKGGNAALTDAEMLAAVTHMANAAK